MDASSWKLRWLLIRAQCNSNNNKKHWQVCRPCPLSAAKAMRQQHKSLHGAGKKSAMLPHAILLPHCMNGIKTLIFFMFKIFFTIAASTTHLCCIYRFIALPINPSGFFFSFFFSGRLVYFQLKISMSIYPSTSFSGRIVLVTK